MDPVGLGLRRWKYSRVLPPGTEAQECPVFVKRIPDDATVGSLVLQTGRQQAKSIGRLGLWLTLVGACRSREEQARRALEQSRRWRAGPPDSYVQIARSRAARLQATNAAASIAGGQMPHQQSLQHLPILDAVMTTEPKMHSHSAPSVRSPRTVRR